MSGIGSKAGGPDYLAQFMGGRFTVTDGEASLELEGTAGPFGGPGDEERPHVDQRAEAANRLMAHEVIARAAATAGSMKDMPVDERAAALARAARLVRQHGRERRPGCLLKIARGSSGISPCRPEVPRPPKPERLGTLIRVDIVRRMGHQPGELNDYFYQPRGTVLALASSRWPLTSACTMAGSALAAGDPVVLKPASRTRESTAYLARLLCGAGSRPTPSATCRSRVPRWARNW